MRKIDIFAALLSVHDLEKGNVGGDVAKCAKAIKINLPTARAMIRKIEKDLGWQSK